MFYNFCIATVSCEVLGGIEMEEKKEEIEWYKERIKWLAENCNNLRILKIIHRFAENLIK